MDADLDTLATALYRHDLCRTQPRRLGKRVGGNPSRVRISYPPPLWPGRTSLTIGRHDYCRVPLVSVLVSMDYPKTQPGLNVEASSPPKVGPAHAELPKSSLD